MHDTAGRGRRVLRRADAGRGVGRRGTGAAPGVRRHALEQAALLLRRPPLAGRRPDPARRRRRRGSSGRNARWRNFDAFDIMSMPDKWEYPWFAAWDMAFHCVTLAHVDPALRQVPVDPAVPGVVPAPQRRAAGLRVGLRRCQPPRPGLGGARSVRHRRRPGHRLPEPRLRQAHGQLHLVGQPRGRRGQQPVRGRVPRSRQHRPDRPFPPAGRRHAGAVRRHRLDGLLRAVHAGHRRRAEPQRPAASGATSSSSSSSTSPPSARPWTTRGCGTTSTACSTTASSPPTGPSYPVKVRSMVGVIPVLAAGVVDEGMLDRSMTIAKQLPRLLRHQGLESEERLATAGLHGEPGSRTLAARRGRHRPLVADLRHAASTSASSSHPTASGPSPPTTASTPTSSTSKASGPASTTSRRSRPPTCSAATPTGGARCGFPLNYLVIDALERYHRFYGDDAQGGVPDRVGRTS